MKVKGDEHQELIEICETTLRPRLRCTSSLYMLRTTV